MTANLRLELKPAHGSCPASRQNAVNPAFLSLQTDVYSTVLFASDQTALFYCQFIQVQSELIVQRASQGSCGLLDDRLFGNAIQRRKQPGTRGEILIRFGNHKSVNADHVESTTQRTQQIIVGTKASQANSIPKRHQQKRAAGVGAPGLSAFAQIVAIQPQCHQYLLCGS